MICAGFASFFGLGLVDGQVPTFRRLPVLRLPGSGLLRSMPTNGGPQTSQRHLQGTLQDL